MGSAGGGTGSGGDLAALATLASASSTPSMPPLAAPPPAHAPPLGALDGSVDSRGPGLLASGGVGGLAGWGAVSFASLSRGEEDEEEPCDGYAERL